VRYIRHFYNILISLLPEWKSNPNKCSLTVSSMNMCIYLLRKERRWQLTSSSLFQSRSRELKKRKRKSSM